jgi:DNA mismatch repair ATPase MutS
MALLVWGLPIIRRSQIQLLQQMMADMRADIKALRSEGRKIMATVQDIKDLASRIAQEAADQDQKMNEVIALVKKLKEGGQGATQEDLDTIFTSLTDTQTHSTNITEDIAQVLPEALPGGDETTGEGTGEGGVTTSEGGGVDEGTPGSEQRAETAP